MSMPRGCCVIERKKGEWMIVVAQQEYDYDFLRGHNVYGPAVSEDEALALMTAHESNPGGFNKITRSQVRKEHLLLIDNGNHIGTSRSRCGPW